MNADTNKIYNYSYLFVVTLVFSAIATEILVLYSLIRQSYGTLYEFLIVGIISCTFFSVLGQKLSKVNEIRRWIFFVSAFSSISYYEIFLTPKILTNIVLEVLASSVYTVLGGWLFWGVFKDWKYKGQVKISRKHIAIIIGSCVIFVLSIFSAYFYTTEIISFFDTHPWAMTLVGVIVTLLGGIFIGRRTKKS